MSLQTASPASYNVLTTRCSQAIQHRRLRRRLFWRRFLRGLARARQATPRRGWASAHRPPLRRRGASTGGRRRCRRSRRATAMMKTTRMMRMRMRMRTRRWRFCMNRTTMGCLRALLARLMAWHDITHYLSSSFQDDNIIYPLQEL